MLGGMVSRATKRHLSLTTVQDAEMEDISLHLRCGNNGAYSSAAEQSSQGGGDKEFSKKRNIFYFIFIFLSAEM